MKHFEVYVFDCYDGGEIIQVRSEVDPSIAGFSYGGGGSDLSGEAHSIAWATNRHMIPPKIKQNVAPHYIEHLPKEELEDRFRPLTSERREEFYDNLENSMRRWAVRGTLDRETGVYLLADDLTYEELRARGKRIHERNVLSVTEGTGYWSRLGKPIPESATEAIEFQQIIDEEYADLKA